MHEWFKISLLLSIFGFLKEIRPSEPFVYEFLIGPWRNVTTQQVMEQVYPVGTYSYLALSFVAFLITDLCRYKPLIILMGVTGIIIWSMLLWTKSLPALQVLEVSTHQLLNLHTFLLLATSFSYKTLWILPLFWFDIYNITISVIELHNNIDNK